MPLIETIQDDFDTDQIATLWVGSFGTPTIVNGRARIITDTSYRALQSSAAYTFNNSYVFVQAFMPVAGGATTEAFAELSIQSGTAGTDIVFSYNAVTGNLTMSNRTAYFDPGSTTLTYNATNHRWLRLRIVGGNILWDTSLDGLTWTNRRSVAASAWATSGTTLAVMIQSHRSDGTNDFCEFDNFNFAPAFGVAEVIGQTALTRASTW